MLQKDLELRKEIIVMLKKTMLTEDILIRLVAFYNTGVDYLLYLTDVKKAYPNSIVEKKTALNFMLFCYQNHTFAGFFQLFITLLQTF